ncbi:MAG: site-specific DNA-methyltransferase [Acidobacteriota bacterium]
MVADGGKSGDAGGPTEALPQQEEFWRPPVRFGSVPVEKEPLGWDRRQGFRKLFPAVMLPTQVVDRVSFGHPELEPNRLFWGDNLHVMRQLPPECIDLIYIDPPFFSGRQYNVIFGDQNELRSFSDIWEGGMPGYLIWLNARLYEMKRLLKKTGSIYVHCDWHASHYIKVEMDKILGHENMMNELGWCYRGGGIKKDRFARKHDTILWYRKGAACKFNVDAVRIPYSDDSLERLNYTARAFRTSGTYDSYRPNKKGKHPDDWFEIQPLMPSEKTERIGYPTQKPLELLQRLIEATTDRGDVVADFFVGGGSLLAAAAGARSVRTSENRPAVKFRPELARRWLGCDQSRVAVALTADRLTSLYESEGLLKSVSQVPDFTIVKNGEKVDTFSG